MKKIIMLTMVFLVVTLVPQISFAQTEVEPAKQEVKTEKSMAVKKEMKETALPVKTEGESTTTVDQKSENADNTPPVAKEGEENKMKNYIVPSKSKPREAIVKPIKNPKNNKVTVGKKIDKEDKDKDKNKEKKLETLKKMD